MIKKLESHHLYFNNNHIFHFTGKLYKTLKKVDYYANAFKTVSLVTGRSKR